MSFLTNIQQSIETSAPVFDVSKMPSFNFAPAEEEKETKQDKAIEKANEAISNFANNLKIKRETEAEQKTADAPAEKKEADLPKEEPVAESAPEEAAAAAPEETVSEEKETAPEPAKEKEEAEPEKKAETAEEETEPKPKKTTRKKTTKKKAEKKEEEAVAAPPTESYVVDLNNRPDFKSADDTIKAYYLDENFINTLKYFNEKIANIRIESDMNAGTLAVVAAQIENAIDELSVPLNNALISYNAFNNKDNGLVATFYANASGSNALARKKETLNALKNAEIDGVPVNLDYMAISSQLRYQALDGLMKRLDAKKGICITMSAAIKIQSKV